ncbi:alternative ribosome rescue aminoacyl-tRNA hydrolase ArfB [Wenzhouxiangella marina]|uniref:Peptide chain release factor I n=1 Tax=Wenzhouxiangella marina TaxID=1579979 RepID=A0A0K0XY39_9GAMM|nr:alternative ribosome rescue aminoacyl-tRNA hydrolase ArfB [Wenzhouxiangella marina]AKS42536.1 peptide chain release factor I [Wenzhouxiangella marina]MBB6085687.1 ribosome-associated protein [Wenzhouxiangella marina]
MSHSIFDERPKHLPPEYELEEKFILTGGPGGQHVNRTETGVQLRFDTRKSARLSPEVRERLLVLAGSRADQHGVITIEARSHRSQHRNREEARERLAELIERAHQRPRKRIPTRPSRTAKKKRLDAKRQRSSTKRQRSKPRLED